MVVSARTGSADNAGVPPLLPEVVIGALVLGGLVVDHLRRSTAGSPRPAVVPVRVDARRRPRRSS
jgi:hypothetical protein